MKKLLLALGVFCILFKTHGQNPTSVNPNNSGANVNLSWLNDISRLRVGGTNPGAGNGFDFQGPSDQSYLRILGNGNVGIATTNPLGSLSLGGWNIGSSGPVSNLTNHSGQMVISGLHNSGNNLSGIKLLIEGHDNDDENYTYPIYVLDENLGVDFYLKSRSSQNGLSEAYYQGKVGIGTTSPDGNLHVSSGVNGDATFLLQADTDNNNEADNARIEILQDGGATGAYIGFNLDWGGSAGVAGAEPDNLFRIGTRYSNSDNYNRLVINTNNGNIGIGTTTPSEKLEVNGTIRTKEVKVESTGWPDYVFSDTYQLNPLSEVSTYIQENHHLPGIPTAEEVAENGIKLGEMNAKLLEKVEELTLYQIQLLEMLEKQQKEIEILKSIVK